MENLRFVLVSMGLVACGNVALTPDAGDPGADAPTTVDAGPDAPPDAPPVPPNIMFVTSTTTTGNMGGLAGADAICAARATAGGLPGTYVAWLSTSTVNAIDRLAGARGWVRPDGKPIADTAADLAAGKLFYPPRLDELGHDVGGDVMVRTSTTIGGVLNVNPDTCQNWTSTAGTVSNTATGWADATSYMFTTHTGMACSSPLALYCLGKDRTGQVAAPQEAGRRAFVSKASWVPGGGLAAADALCQTEATTAGLPGTYKAMLATNGASAASRFNLTGAHWVRVDGAAITATAAGLFNAALLDTGINVTADGQTYLGNYLQWTGAGGGSLNGTSASSCVNWTASTATSSGQTGVVGRTNTSVMSGTGMFACNIGYAKITCLQE